MSRWPTDLPIFLTDTGQLKLDERARFRKAGDFRNWQMLSKKSKIERLRKSREDQFFVVSAAASLCRACTRVCDRFCVIRYGPSRCHAWDAPAALKNFVRQPEETFSTASARMRSAATSAILPLWGKKRKRRGHRS